MPVANAFQHFGVVTPDGNFVDGIRAGDTVEADGFEPLLVTEEILSCVQEDAVELGDTAFGYLHVVAYRRGSELITHPRSLDIAFTVTASIEKWTIKFMDTFP